MALRPQQLSAQLEKGLAPVYLIAGAETLLVQECRDAVIRAGQAQGFTERDLFEVGQGFDWGRMGEDSAAMSLFSSRKIIDLRLPTGKPGQEGAKTLVARAENPDPDELLIVSCDQWSAAQRKTKWASRLAAAGVLVEAWPIKPQELPGWIRGRMKQAGLAPEPDAISLLSEMVEGNLLAAQQEIDKWVMLGGDRTITAADVEKAVADSSRFDAFRLVESVLAGRLADSLRVSTGLKRTGVAIQLVIGALHREMTVAATLAQALRAGETESVVFRRLGVWPARQGPMRAAAGRLSTQDFDRAFSMLTRIEMQGKGRAFGDPWQTLDRMLWFMCDPGEGRGLCAAQVNP